jgi:hypothetical protein
MTPIDQARAVYSQEWCARTFDEDLALHLSGGYVFSTPTMFLMGRPVRSDAPPDEIVNPAVSFSGPDAWLVYLLAGSLREALEFIPYPLPFVGWERANILRFHAMDRVRGIYSCQSKSKG